MSRPWNELEIRRELVARVLEQMRPPDATQASGRRHQQAVVGADQVVASHRLDGDTLRAVPTPDRRPRRARRSARTGRRSTAKCAVPDGELLHVVGQVKDGGPADRSASTTARMMPADASRTPKSLSRLTNGGACRPTGIGRRPVS